MIIKGCVQWNSVYGWEGFTSSEDWTRSARSVGQRLTHWATGTPVSMKHLKRKVVGFYHWISIPLTVCRNSNQSSLYPIPVSCSFRLLLTHPLYKTLISSDNPLSVTSELFLKICAKHQNPAYNWIVHRLCISKDSKMVCLLRRSPHAGFFSSPLIKQSWN